MLAVSPGTEPPLEATLDIADLSLSTGHVRLWLPEAVTTDRGFAGFYPWRLRWSRQGDRLAQHAETTSAFGEGNVSESSPGVLECEGVRMAREVALPWDTSYVVSDHRVEFALAVHNPYDVLLPKVGAAACLRFLDQSWWNDACCVAVTADGTRSIADLGRAAGRPNTFQAWLMEHESYNHPFYREFWGFGEKRVAAPLWVSRNQDAGHSVVIACESAYFIHSNSWNPCTDVALKLGDLGPGESVTRRGFVEFTLDSIDQILARLRGYWQKNG